MARTLPELSAAHWGLGRGLDNLERDIDAWVGGPDSRCKTLTHSLRVCRLKVANRRRSDTDTLSMYVLSIFNLTSPIGGSMNIKKINSQSHRGGAQCAVTSLVDRC